MNKKNNSKTTHPVTAAYDDGNIPDVDLPSGEDSLKPEPSLSKFSHTDKDVNLTNRKK